MAVGGGKPRVCVAASSPADKPFRPVRPTAPAPAKLKAGRPSPATSDRIAKRVTPAGRRQPGAMNAEVDNREGRVVGVLSFSAQRRRPAEAVRQRRYTDMPAHKPRCPDRRLVVVGEADRACAACVGHVGGPVQLIPDGPEAKPAPAVAAAYVDSPRFAKPVNGTVRAAGFFVADVLGGVAIIYGRAGERRAIALALVSVGGQTARWRARPERPRHPP